MELSILVQDHSTFGGRPEIRSVDVGLSEQAFLLLKFPFDDKCSASIVQAALYVYSNTEKALCSTVMQC